MDNQPATAMGDTPAVAPIETMAVAAKGRVASRQTLKRHDLVVPVVHWLVALSTFALFFSGFGQMPMYRRYMVDRLPGLAWSSDFGVTLIIHYVAAMVLLFAAVLHLVYHGVRREFDILPRRGDLKESARIMKAMITGGPEPPSHKYLAEQRLSYALTAVGLLVVILTGLVKVYKNLPGVSLPQGVLVTVTTLHNAGTFLTLFSVLGHLAAFLFKPNRKLLPAIFTGRVDLEYAKHRHSLWYEQIARESGEVEKPGSSTKQ
jgi:cytochrome b subunit of formate dehydrogenase